MTKKKNTMETKNEYKLRSFMSNVNKLDMYIHRRTHSDMFGTVKLVKSALENKGKRKFSISKSPLISSGSYTYSTLRSKLAEAIG